MHFHQVFTWLCCLCVLQLATAIAIDPQPLRKRGIAKGWALAQSSCPASTKSCGDGSCCPSSLFCFEHANMEIAACCPTNSQCRGDIESSPKCANSEWSQWVGSHGNSFCCVVGQQGAYRIADGVAGTCVASGNVASGFTTAVLKTAGTGSPVTSSPPTMDPSPTTTTTTTTPGPTTPGTPGTTGKPVFFHYMIGTISDAHCKKDIQDAKALGADAFALNINTVTATWATTTVEYLFKYAAEQGFKLFFSFDMTGFNNPGQFIDFLKKYAGHSAHYKYNGLPFVSTFNGGQNTFGYSSVSEGWKKALQDPMANAPTSQPIYFVPAFQDITITSSFYSTFPTLDGAMNWDSWPQNNQGKIVVPTNLDQTLQTAGKPAGKTFMMGVSPLQFKHMDGGNNWYRRGEQNLEYRFGQVLQLQPDFVEIQTWNDAGESHYMGNSWPEPIAGSNIGTYTDGYDHTGYKEILPAFIKAYKSGAKTTNGMYPTNGATAQGTFWHHTLLTSGSCSDNLGKPQGADTAEDRVTAIILVAAGQTGLRAVFTSGNATLGTQSLVAGFNGFSFGGLTTGLVTVKVLSSAGTTLISGTGPISVTGSANLCNYNFQVVGLH